MPEPSEDRTHALAPAGAGEPSTPRRRLPSLHDDPHKIHQLIDLLGLPPGTEVRVTTVAASVIVR